MTDLNTMAQYFAELVRKGAQLGDCGRMCSDCAFKPDQPHTPEYLGALEAATSALVWEGRFNCHTEDHQNAHKPCAGFLYARQYLNSQIGENPVDNV